jgi:hypothetical protein
MCDLPRLYDYATRFRAAIESCDKRSLPITFERFPRGSCGDATLLLGKYLEESGFGKFNYVLGERNGNSHAWLENDEVIIDITADQFLDMPHQVFVACESEWHSSFHGEVLHVADPEIYDEHTRITLRRAYGVVMNYLSQHESMGSEP